MTLPEFTYIGYMPINQFDVDLSRERNPSSAEPPSFGLWIGDCNTKKTRELPTDL